MKKCFTINPFRVKKEIESYHYLFKNNLYQAIEIFYPYNLDIDKQNEYTNNILNIKKYFPNIEVVMHLPFGKDNNLCDFNNYKKTLELIKKAIIYTKEFSTKKLTLHLGYVNNEINRDIYIEHIVKVLTDLSDFANQYQMHVMIENMPKINELGYSPVEILNIIKKVNRINLKFIYDTGHAHVSDFDDLDYIFLLKEYLYHIHLNDNMGLNDEHKKFGLGNFDFISLIKLLKVINYQELFCMEIIFNNVVELVEFSKVLDNFDK